MTHYEHRTNPSCSDIEHIWQVAWRLGFYRGGAVFMSAISGIDIALWDLKGELFTCMPPPLTIALFNWSLAQYLIYRLLLPRHYRT